MVTAKKLNILATCKKKTKTMTTPIILTANTIYNSIDLMTTLEREERMTKAIALIHKVMDDVGAMSNDVRKECLSNPTVLVNLYNISHEFLILSSYLTDGYTTDMAYAKLIMNAAKNMMANV